MLNRHYSSYKVSQISYNSWIMGGWRETGVGRRDLHCTLPPVGKEIEGWGSRGQEEPPTLVHCPLLASELNLSSFLHV